jgi:hypothetical protein
MRRFGNPLFVSRETRDSRALRQKTLIWLEVCHRIVQPIGRVIHPSCCRAPPAVALFSLGAHAAHPLPTGSEKAIGKSNKKEECPLFLEIGVCRKAPEVGRAMPDMVFTGHIRYTGDCSVEDEYGWTSLKRISRPQGPSPLWLELSQERLRRVQDSHHQSLYSQAGTQGTYRHLIERQRLSPRSSPQVEANPESR